jgi:hypothetical protein
MRANGDNDYANGDFGYPTSSFILYGLLNTKTFKKII